MKFLAGSNRFLLLGLLGLLAVSHGPQVVNAQSSLTPKALNITLAPTLAPTKAPSAAPTVADDLLQDEEKNPVVVIDMKVAGATQDQVEAMAALVKALTQYIANNMPFQIGNTSKINVTVEWRGTVVEGGSSPTRFLRALPVQGLQELLNNENEDNRNKRCSLNVGDTANVTTITIHGLHGKAPIEQFLSLFSSGAISVWTAEHFPAFNFVCASEVRMSNEAPSMQFQIMNAEEEEKKGPNTAAIVVPVIFGVAFVGAVGFVLVKKFAVGAAVATV